MPAATANRWTDGTWRLDAPRWLVAKGQSTQSLPFSAWTANLVWFEIVLLAALLLAALQILIGDDNDLSVAEPRRLRYTLIAIAARVIRSHGQIHLRLDRTWPWTAILVAVHRRLDTSPTTATC